MKPGITAITLGVDNLEQAVRFYSEGLGFPTAGYFQDPDQHLWEVVWNPEWQ